jgi:hypothetical protein
MPTEADFLDLQKRLFAVERLLRAGIPTNNVSGDESTITIIADNDPEIIDPPTEALFPGKQNDMYMIYNHLD